MTDVKIPPLTELEATKPDLETFSYVLEGLRPFQARRQLVIAMTMLYVYRRPITSNRWRLTLFNSKDPKCAIIHRTHGRTGVFIWDDKKCRFVHESVAEGLFPLTDVVRNHFELKDGYIKYSETFFSSEGYTAIMLGHKSIGEAIEEWEKVRPGYVLYKQVPPPATSSQAKQGGG
jgi:hypothetical protein